MSVGYRLGAVVYHPNVKRIWEEFGAWFGEQRLPLEPHYFERYEDQVAALLAGRLETAWNTNLAHVQVLQATDGAADALAMRDTDRGWRSLLVALENSGLRELDDLRGRRVGFGDADSPQAQIMPVHALRAAGFDPEHDCIASRLDRDIGKHGDTGGAELAQLARVRSGELDACAVSNLTLDAVRRLGDAGDLREIWSRRRFTTAASRSWARTSGTGASASCCSRWTSPTRNCASRWSSSRSPAGSHSSRPATTR